MKVFLDDLRDAPAGFMRAFRPDEIGMFIHLARHATEISLDHDLGLDPEGKQYPTGNDVLKILEREVHQGILWGNGAPIIMCHSANPVGKKNIEDTIQSIYSCVGRRVTLNQ